MDALLVVAVPIKAIPIIAGAGILMDAVPAETHLVVAIPIETIPVEARPVETIDVETSRVETILIDLAHPALPFLEVFLSFIRLSRFIVSSEKKPQTKPVETLIAPLAIPVEAVPVEALLVVARGGQTYSY